jgi:acyl-CoA reductase-like NAD-dependent aldehyde dehydrogenase
MLKNTAGKLLANVSRSSRKDYRDAVLSARKAQPAWVAKSAYNKGQVLYRIAELLEGRKEQFLSELSAMGATKKQAVAEVHLSIDRLVYYAGWSDKYQQVYSSVNPVETAHFNFSFPEPTGVVAILAPEEYGLIGLISTIAPALVGGNAAVVLASYPKPLCAVTFAEVLHAADVPAGVVNILTGIRSELLPYFSNHMDVNACVYCGQVQDDINTVKLNGALNLKRTRIYDSGNWMVEDAQHPCRIMDLQEIKTTWHPIGS